MGMAVFDSECMFYMHLAKRSREATNKETTSVINKTPVKQTTKVPAITTNIFFKVNKEPSTASNKAAALKQTKVPPKAPVITDSDSDDDKVTVDDMSMKLMLSERYSSKEDNTGDDQIEKKFGRNEEGLLTPITVFTSLIKGVRTAFSKNNKSDSNTKNGVSPVTPTTHSDVQFYLHLDNEESVIPKTTFVPNNDILNDDDKASDCLTSLVKQQKQKQGADLKQREYSKSPNSQGKPGTFESSTDIICKATECVVTDQNTILKLSGLHVNASNNVKEADSDSNNTEVQAGKDLDNALYLPNKNIKGIESNNLSIDTQKESPLTNTSRLLGNDISEMGTSPNEDLTGEEESKINTRNLNSVKTGDGNSLVRTSHHHQEHTVNQKDSDDRYPATFKHDSSSKFQTVLPSSKRTQQVPVVQPGNIENTTKVPVVPPGNIENTKSKDGSRVRVSSYIEESKTGEMLHFITVNSLKGGNNDNLKENEIVKSDDQIIPPTIDNTSPSPSSSSSRNNSVRRTSSTDSHPLHQSWQQSSEIETHDPFDSASHQMDGGQGKLLTTELLARGKPKVETLSPFVSIKNPHHNRIPNINNSLEISQEICSRSTSPFEAIAILKEETSNTEDEFTEGEGGGTDSPFEHLF